MDDQNLTPTAAQPAEPTRRRRKLLALGAGGLVLGIGAVVTMAAWTDTEVATGDFAAGTFGIEGSADGTEFSSHTGDDSMLTLEFDAQALNLSPGDSTSEVYAVRLMPGSTYAASITSAVSASGTAADNLSYTIETVGDIDGGGTASTVVDSEAVTDTDPDAGIFSLTSLDQPVFLKVTVTADDALDQGETANVVWTLTGTSGDALGS